MLRNLVSPEKKAFQTARLPLPLPLPLPNTLPCPTQAPTKGLRRGYPKTRKTTMNAREVRNTARFTENMPLVCPASLDAKAGIDRQLYDNVLHPAHRVLCFLNHSSPHKCALSSKYAISLSKYA